MRDWKRLPDRIVYRQGRFQVVEDRWVRPDGTLLRTPLLKSPSFSVVVGVTGAREIPLVKNLHPAPGLRLLELPGGRIELDETPRAAARRELSEETGWNARKLTRIGRYYPNPHWGTFQGHVFLAEGLRPGRTHPDPGEWLRPVLVPVREAYRALGQGRFFGGSTLVGLHLAEAPLRARGFLDPR